MTPPEKILVVDDEETIRATVSAALRSRKLETQTAADATEALNAIDQTTFDLAILDLRLPGAMDGVGLMNEIRDRSPQTTIVMMSAYATVDSAIVALRQGAHDYLLKPFTMAQVIESVERALIKRREAEQKAATKTTAPLRVDHAQRMVYCGDNPVVLSVTEFDLFAYLFGHSERIVTASELMKAVQGYDLDERDARTIVRVHIQRIRQKLGDDPDFPRYIQNVRGKGYRIMS